MMKIKRPKTHLPSVATFLTIHKCCHGFICTSCLYLNTKQVIRSKIYDIIYCTICYSIGIRLSIWLRFLPVYMYNVFFDIFHIWTDLLGYQQWRPSGHRWLLLLWTFYVNFLFHHWPFPDKNNMYMYLNKEVHILQTIFVSKQTMIFNRVCCDNLLLSLLKYPFCFRTSAVILAILSAVISLLSTACLSVGFFESRRFDTLLRILDLYFEFVSLNSVKIPAMY